MTRREFLSRNGKLGLGALALQTLTAARLFQRGQQAANPLSAKAPPLPSKVKSVIYLGMSGAPPQHDLFDWKPELVKHHLQDCPEEFLKGQTFTAFIKEKPAETVRLALQVQAICARAGAWVSEIAAAFPRRSWTTWRSSGR